MKPVVNERLEYDPKDLIGSRFLCTIRTEHTIRETAIVAISPSGNYVKLEMEGNALGEWFSRATFPRDVIILELLS